MTNARNSKLRRAIATIRRTWAEMDYAHRRLIEVNTDFSDRAAK
jgi:hypothetical protein